MPKGVYVRQRTSLLERFEKKVLRTDDGHWLWTGALTKNGYGKIGVGGHRGGWALAHRVAWELYREPIPAGLHIDHLCRNRACVNPEHLEPVTHAENLRRGDGPPSSRPWSLKTHCKHGHEFTPENTSLDSRGHKRCRTCTRERDRKRKRAKSRRSELG
jgi:hypothetical protein